ncbi:hypothetical protein HK405_009270, partial [Cladochytrium tenue]
MLASGEATQPDSTIVGNDGSGVGDENSAPARLPDEVDVRATDAAASAPPVVVPRLVARRMGPPVDGDGGFGGGAGDGGVVPARPEPVSVVSRRLQGLKQVLPELPAFAQGRRAHSILGLSAEEFALMDRELGGDSSESDRDDGGDGDGDGADAAAHARLAGDELAGAAAERAKEEDLERDARRRRRDWLGRLHAFQRYVELREERALRNWRRHRVEWMRVERRVAAEAGKDTGDLLMARLGEFRERMEEQALVEEALRLLETEPVEFWGTGIRLGNDLLGLMATIPRGGGGRSYQVDSKANSYRSDRKQELGGLVSQLDPFFDGHRSGFLEVVGRGVRAEEAERLARLAEAYAQRLEVRASRDTVERITSGSAAPPSRPTSHLRKPSPSLLEPELDDGAGTTDAGGELHPGPAGESAAGKGPAVEMTATQLVYETVLSEASTSVLTVYNRGSTAVHFEWRKARRLNPLGLFTETWTLATYPRVSGYPMTVTLQGLAIEEDTLSHRRAAVDARLRRRQATTIATETIEGILARLGTTPSDGSLGSTARTGASDPAKTFAARNAELRLHFDVQVYAELQALYLEILAAQGSEFAAPSDAWDGSVATLHELAQGITDPSVQSAMLERLQLLVRQCSGRAVLNSSVAVAASAAPTGPADQAAVLASMPRVSSGGGFPLRYILCHDILVDVVDGMYEISEALRRRMELPTPVRVMPPDRQVTSALFCSASSFAEMKLPTAMALQQQQRKKTARQTPQQHHRAARGLGRLAQRVTIAVGERLERAQAQPRLRVPLRLRAQGQRGLRVELAAKLVPQAALLRSEEQNPALARPLLGLGRKAAVTLAQQADSPREWTPGRRRREREYRAAFRDEVRGAVAAAVWRMAGLLDDAADDDGSGDRPSRGADAARHGAAAAVAGLVVGDGGAAAAAHDAALAAAVEAAASRRDRQMAAGATPEYATAAGGAGSRTTAGGG